MNVTTEGSVERIVEGIASRDRRAAARAMRLVDDRGDGYETLLDALYPSTGRARVVGIAGSPGCGKSTLVDGLVRCYRETGESVGVVAVDPSSSISGGAILGDRIRMQRHADDAGVFIRSVATRGAVGGLSSSTQDIARIMDAMGFDVVLIETVGVGQDEVEIASVADVVAVVLSPDTGDAVQIMKAGLMEVGDVFVVNKADRAGADAVSRELLLLYQLDRVSHPPPVIETVATRAEGIGELRDALEGHTLACGDEDHRRRLRAELKRRLAERVVQSLSGGAADEMEKYVEAIVAGGSTPYSAVAALLERIGGS